MKFETLRDDLVNRVLRYPTSIGVRIRVAYYRLLGTKIGERCYLKAMRIPRNPWDVLIGNDTYIDDFTVLLSTGKRGTSPRIIIGSNCGFNRFSLIDASEKIEIGDNVRVGPHVYITDHDHGFARGEKVCKQALVGKPVKFHDDVWIGAGACILKGVTVGEGAIIGAGAVVTRDIQAWTVVGGIPARQIGVRQ